MTGKPVARVACDERGFDLPAELLRVGQVAMYEMAVFLLGPGIPWPASEVKGLAMRPQVVIGLHEIFHQYLPVEFALPFLSINDFKAGGLPRGDGSVHLYQARGEWRRVPLQVDEEKPFQTSQRNSWSLVSSLWKHSACCISGQARKRPSRSNVHE